MPGFGLFRKKKTTPTPATTTVTTSTATKKKGFFQRWFGKKSKKISNRRQVFGPTNEEHKKLMILQLRKVRKAESAERKKEIAKLKKEQADLNLPPENPFATEGQNTAYTLPFYKTNKPSVSRKKRNINRQIENIKALRHKGSNTRIKTPSTANKIYRNDIKPGNTNTDLTPFSLEISAPKTQLATLDDIVKITNITSKKTYKLSEFTNLGYPYTCTERHAGTDKRNCNLFVDYNKIQEALLSFLSISKENISPETILNAKKLFILKVQNAITNYIALAKQFSHNEDIGILPFIASESPNTYIKYYYSYQYTSKSAKVPVNKDFLFIITDTAVSNNAKLHAFYRDGGVDLYRPFKISAITEHANITRLINTETGKFNFPPSDETMGEACTAIADVIKNYGTPENLIAKLHPAT